MDLIDLPAIVCAFCGENLRSSQIAQKCDPKHPFFSDLFPKISDSFFVLIKTVLLVSSSGRRQGQVTCVGWTTFIVTNFIECTLRHYY